jgi:hypothetical protein
MNHPVHTEQGMHSNSYYDVKQDPIVSMCNIYSTRFKKWLKHNALII